MQIEIDNKILNKSTVKGAYLLLDASPTNLNKNEIYQKQTDGRWAMKVEIIGVGSSYELPIASASVLGGIKVGSGLSIAGDGTLSASGGSSITLTTTGTSGAATLISGTLNIPIYQAAGSYVTAVSVTTNQGVSGTSSGGTTPALTISLGALTGVTSFNGLVITANTGVVTTGTWQGTKVAIAYGGTNSSTALSNNRIMISSGGAIVEQSAITADRIIISDTNGLPIAADTATYPSLTEFSYVKGGTSNFQTQIDSKVSINRSDIIAQQGTDGATSVGTTITYSIGLPVDTAKLNLGDIIVVTAAMKRLSGNASTISMVLYANTTNDLSGSPIQIGTSTTMGTTSYRQIMSRQLPVKAKASSGDTIEAFNVTTAALAEIGQTSNTTLSNLAINTLTGTFYIIAAIKTFAGGDDACISFLNIARC